MICPSCTASSVAVQHKFVPLNLSIRITCPVCKKRPSSAQWRCNCGVPWHTCARHATHHVAPKVSGNRSRNRAKGAVKRHNTDADALLDDDLMQESKKARLDLHNTHRVAQASIQRTRTIPIGMVPNALRVRFPTSLRHDTCPMHAALGRPPDEPPD